jgi:hypothetical protein
MSSNYLTLLPLPAGRRSHSDSPSEINPDEGGCVAVSEVGGLVLLLLIFFCTCGPAPLIAQQNSPIEGRGAAQIYTGNEAPVCFDTQRYQNRAVESYPILQFLGARCAEVTKLTATKGLFRYKDAHQHNPEYQRLPLDVYFQPKGEPLEELYHINTGSAMLHITLPMRYEGTYYVVIRDQVKPSVLIVNSVTLEAEFRRCCALTESIIPKYLHRKQ